MNSKVLSEVEQAVETFVTQDCGITYEVFFTGEQTRDDWTCDGWKFNIKGQSFDYFTGTGHRVDNDSAKFARIALKNVSRNSIAWHDGVIKNQVAVKPPIAGLLYSLILDGSACDESFASWCDNFGYDTDSRKALATYEACQQGFDKMRKVFTGAQIEHIRELLQDY